jgi:hypothetical protein
LGVADPILRAAFAEEYKVAAAAAEAEDDDENETTAEPKKDEL